MVAIQGRQWLSALRRAAIEHGGLPFIRQKEVTSAGSRPWASFHTLALHHPGLPRAFHAVTQGRSASAAESGGALRAQVQRLLQSRGSLGGVKPGRQPAGGGAAGSRGFHGAASQVAARHGAAVHRWQQLPRWLVGGGGRGVPALSWSTHQARFALQQAGGRGLQRLYSSGAAEDVVPRLVAGGEAAERAVSRWLYGCSAWVFSMVVLGGVTRLTRSGLSMTDWKFAGGLPPLTQEEWEAEFTKYQQSPEYKKVNIGMRLEDFKFIFYMEYAHRMWGRGLGVFFAGPALYFAARGYITARLGRRLGVLLALGASQGFIGWWMVKSGLEEPPSEHGVPRVSPYRLAAHLSSAFLIYSLLLWTALSVASPVPAAVSLPLGFLPGSRRARMIVHPVAALVGLTAFSGAFVAGNDAGHAFNTWPLMGDTFVPEGIWEMQPLVKNFFENTATVQFDHRMLAYTTAAAVGTGWAFLRSVPLPARARLFSNGMLGMTALQVTLGVQTILNHVPVWLGALHQAGALLLFSILLGLMHSVRKAPRLAFNPALVFTSSAGATPFPALTALAGITSRTVVTPKPWALIKAALPPPSIARAPRPSPPLPPPASPQMAMPSLKFPAAPKSLDKTAPSPPPPLVEPVVKPPPPAASPSTPPTVVPPPKPPPAPEPVAPIPPPPALPIGIGMQAPSGGGGSVFTSGATPAVAVLASSSTLPGQSPQLAGASGTGKIMGVSTTHGVIGSTAPPMGARTTAHEVVASQAVVKSEVPEEGDDPSKHGLAQLFKKP